MVHLTLGQDADADNADDTATDERRSVRDDLCLRPHLHLQQREAFPCAHLPVEVGHAWRDAPNGANGAVAVSQHPMQRIDGVVEVDLLVRLKHFRLASEADDVRSETREWKIPQKRKGVGVGVDADVDAGVGAGVGEMRQMWACHHVN